MNECIIHKPRAIPQPLDRCLTDKGQAMVEFIIGLILLIIVAWIPADFGLAFYTSQIAQNAAREGTKAAYGPKFGPIGLILGPLSVSLLLAVVRIYLRDFPEPPGKARA